MTDEMERELGAYGLDEHESWFEIRDLIVKHLNQTALCARLDELKGIKINHRNEVYTTLGFFDFNDDVQNIRNRILELEQLTTNKSKEK